MQVDRWDAMSIEMPSTSRSGFYPPPRPVDSDPGEGLALLGGELVASALGAGEPHTQPYLCSVGQFFAPRPGYDERSFPLGVLGERGDTSLGRTACRRPLPLPGLPGRGGRPWCGRDAEEGQALALPYGEPVPVLPLRGQPPADVHAVHDRPGRHFPEHLPGRHKTCQGGVVALPVHRPVRPPVRIDRGEQLRPALRPHQVLADSALLPGVGQPLSEGPVIIAAVTGAASVPYAAKYARAAPKFSSHAASAGSQTMSSSSRSAARSGSSVPARIARR